MKKILSSFVLVAALALGGCHHGAAEHGGTAAAHDPIRHPWEPLAIVDPSSLAVLRVDLAVVRQQQRYLQLLHSLVLDGDQSGGEQAAARDAVLSIMDSTSEAVLSFTRLDVPEPPGMLVLRGTYPEDALARLASASPRLTMTPRPPFTTYTSDTAALVQLGTHTILVGTRAEIEGALDRMLTSSPSNVLDQPRLAALADRSGFASSNLGLVVALDPAALRYVGVRLPAEVSDHILGVRANVDLSNGVGIHATVLTDGDYAAQGFVDAVNNALAPVRRSTMLRMMGLTDVIDALQMQVRGHDVDVHYALAAARVDVLVQQLDAIVQMMRSE